MSALPFPVGRTIFESGIFTQANAIAGKSRFDVERCMGFNAGRLSMGYTVAHLLNVPGYNDWTFRRHTDLVGPAPGWDEEDGPDTRTAEEILIADGKDVPFLKNEVMRYDFTTSGPTRLIKIIPVINPNGWPQYPEAGGAPQVVLLTNQSMTVAAFVGPNDTYTT
jgi:hypothetical protein